MDDATLVARHGASMRALYGRLIPTTPLGCVLTLDGDVQASIAPSLPERSLFNAVVYEGGEALLRHRDGIADAYARAGVRAWTVWVHPGDDDVAAALGLAGHLLDGEPLRMGAALTDLDLDADPRAAAVDVDEDPTWAALAALNDAAYGVPAERSFRSAFAGLRRGDLDAWIARVGGAPAAGVATGRVGEDCGVWFVATRPEHRGKGLARELLRVALADAGRAGATSTTLEATALGEPVYRRLGYRPLGRLQMWEHRAAD